MSMSVGLRTMGSQANNVTSSPAAVLKLFSEAIADSSPTPAGFAAKTEREVSANRIMPTVTRHRLGFGSAVVIRKGPFTGGIPKPAQDEVRDSRQQFSLI